MTPTQRSLAALRDAGHTVAVVEKWNPHAKIRQDLFGFADLIGLAPGGITAYQVTSGSNVSKRIAKIHAEPNALKWIQSGGKIVVHGWRKVKVKRGGKLTRWELRAESVTERDLNSRAAAEGVK